MIFSFHYRFIIVTPFRFSYFFIFSCFSFRSRFDYFISFFHCLTFSYFFAPLTSHFDFHFDFIFIIRRHFRHFAIFIRQIFFISLFMLPVAHELPCFRFARRHAAGMATLQRAITLRARDAMPLIYARRGHADSAYAAQAQADAARRVDSAFDAAPRRVRARSSRDYARRFRCRPADAVILFISPLIAIFMPLISLLPIFRFFAASSFSLQLSFLIIFFDDISPLFSLPLSLITLQLSPFSFSTRFSFRWRLSSSPAFSLFSCHLMPITPAAFARPLFSRDARCCQRR